jgi:hypothetical protein
MKRLAISLILAAALQGCGSAADREADGASSVHFITFGPRVSGLVSSVKKSTLTACLQGVAAGDQKRWAEDIQSTVLKWVRPLRALTSDKLVGSVNVVSSGNRCDFNVVVNEGTHSNASIGSRPTIRMDREGYFASYNVLLHEMGHGFALSDTYQGGRSGNCKPGQPQAVMCNTSFSDLQKDDVEGVTRIFKQTFPNDVPGQNPAVDPAAEFGKMKFAVALGNEVAPDTYKLAVGLSGGAEQADAEAAICYGSEVDCRASESGWRTLERVVRRGDATIFRDSEETAARINPLFTVRYKNAVGAAYATFGLRDLLAQAP